MKYCIIISVEASTRQAEKAKGKIMNSNKSTEAQRSYIAGLAKRIGDDTRVAEILAEAFAINGNRPWSGHGDETLTQATNRITKTAASKAIELLKAEVA